MVRAANKGRNIQWAPAKACLPRPPRRRPLRPLRMMTRAEWAALPPPADDPGPRLELPVRHLRYTFTGGDICADAEQCLPVVQQMQREALERGEPDIMYNFLVGGDGIIFEARGWDYKCTGNDPWVNSPGESLSIAYIGTHDVNLAPVPMRDAGKHIKEWALNYNLLAKFHEVTPHLACGPYSELLDGEVMGAEQVKEEEEEGGQGVEGEEQEEEQIRAQPYDDIRAAFDDKPDVHDQRGGVEEKIDSGVIAFDAETVQGISDLRDDKDDAVDDDVVDDDRDRNFDDEIVQGISEFRDDKADADDDDGDERVDRVDDGDDVSSDDSDADVKDVNDRDDDEAESYSGDDDVDDDDSEEDVGVDDDDDDGGDEDVDDDDGDDEDFDDDDDDGSDEDADSDDDDDDGDDDDDIDDDDVDIGSGDDDDDVDDDDDDDDDDIGSGDDDDDDMEFESDSDESGDDISLDDAGEEEDGGDDQDND